MEVWSFHLPTRVVFGEGCLDRIFSVVDSFKPSRIMLVTGRKSMRESGVTGRIINYLEGYQVVVYDKVGGNPTNGTVEDGIQFLKDEGCDLVIGLGGGSVVDTAKAISLLSKNPGSVDDYLSEKREIVNRKLPLIAIPTTAGTGSEVTQYASIIDERKKRKISLTHEYIYPDVAIVDPVLTVAVPKFVTAITGLDVLSQCIEAYWSKLHTPISDIFALNGIKLIFENLKKAFIFRDNMESKKNMALASLFSGVAIGIARTTIVHSVSYPLTVRFKIPHGLACSLTLPSFIKYNAEVVRGRIEDVARTIGTNTTEELIKKVEKLISEVELPKKLSDVGVKKRDINLIVKEGFRPDRTENNPRKITAEDLREILESIL